jgi:hypothetical protein
VIAFRHPKAKEMASRIPALFQPLSSLNFPSHFKEVMVARHDPADRPEIA